MNIGDPVRVGKLNPFGDPHPYAGMQGTIDHIVGQIVTVHVEQPEKVGREYIGVSAMCLEAL